MTSPLATTPGLEAHGLDCVRGERVLFRGLTLAAGPGDLVQVTGANGSGKSSLLRILAGLLPPAAGAVHWRGRDIADEFAAYCRDTRFLGHLDGLKAGLTALENLAFAAGMAGDAAVAPQDAIAAMGLPRRVRHAPVRTLSAGQRRRVALGRLLLHRAPLWLLDEPLTALDRETREIVERMFADHLDDGGIIVFSSHAALESPALAARRGEISL